MDNIIVEFIGVSKVFNQLIANDNISLQIKQGEIMAILGENGAGKSTLMSMLFGMYEPDAGTIKVKGDIVSINSPRLAASLNIGMVHQHFKLVSNYTVTKNIILGDEPIKKIAGILPYVDLKKATKDVQALSLKHGLDIDPNAIINQLSISFQQRVEILKMLYKEAEILIFDEPTAVLTPQEISYFLEIVLKLKEQGKTIILITHKLEEIMRVADRCAILRKGKLIDVLETKSCTKEQLSTLMIGRALSSPLEKQDFISSEPVLVISELNAFNQDKVQVLNNINLRVHKGEIHAIAGVSGNGQIELANAIVGLIPAQAKVLKLNNIDLQPLTIAKRNQSGISYIPEDRHHVGLILDFTLEDNLVLKEFKTDKYSTGLFLNKTNITNHANEMIKTYDIRQSLGSKTIARSMSGGNQQKIIVAREIELDNDLIIFVQPTRGLDVGAIENIHHHIIALANQGKAILLISLELEEVMNLADTISVIYNGSIIKTGAAKTLSRKQVGAYMMGVINSET
ncbi:MAG: ABC transporter ATP-binding protein [Bacilli bacterium]